MALGYVEGWTRDVDNTHVAELNALVLAFAVRQPFLPPSFNNHVVRY
jgi:hypothetical protein